MTSLADSSCPRQDPRPADHDPTYDPANDHDHGTDDDHSLHDHHELVML